MGTGRGQSPPAAPAAPGRRSGWAASQQAASGPLPGGSEKECGGGTSGPPRGCAYGRCEAATTASTGRWGRGSSPGPAGGPPCPRRRRNTRPPSHSCKEAHKPRPDCKGPAGRPTAGTPLPAGSGPPSRHGPSKRRFSGSPAPRICAAGPREPGTTWRWTAADPGYSRRTRFPPPAGRGCKRRSNSWCRRFCSRRCSTGWAFPGRPWPPWPPPAVRWQGSCRSRGQTTGNRRRSIRLRIRPGFGRPWR